MPPLRNAARSAGIGFSNVLAWWAKKTAGPANVLNIKLSGRVVEDVQLSGLWQRFMPAPPITMRDLLSVINLASEDDSIKLLLLRIGRHDLGWGKAQELCRMTKRFRSAGGHALAFLEEPGNLDTMIASACDRVVIPPGAPLQLTGLLSEIMYFKEVLDRLEVEPELFHTGKYKSAVEPYTRTGMSREHREAMESLLDSIYKCWSSQMASGRGLSQDRVKELIDQGPFMAPQAKEAGLVDELAYADELDDYIQRWLGFAPKMIDAERFMRLFGPRPSIGDPWKKSRALALITAAGPIHGGESRFYGAGDATTGADTIRRALREVREDDRIAAVVLRVDSPGGSAVHSDLIWREVERLARAKPVIASMADVAASGGYYIAMAANTIIASPTTITGSIGVIGGKINLKGLYNKIGIKKEHVARGKHADMLTDYGPLAPELKEKIKNETETVYRSFVAKAAESRKREEAQIEKAAQGRVWTGEQAEDLGLVDRTGSLIEAIERAKESAGIPLWRKVPVAVLPRLKRMSFPGIPFPLPLPGGAGALHNLVSSYSCLADESTLAIMPYLLKIT